MTLSELFSILKIIIPNKVFYGINVYDNNDNAEMPYIVYQVISKRPIGYHDNVPILYMNQIQITLVSSSKSISLEETLETTLLKNNLNFTMISEFINDDKSVNRIYEISMEENINGEQ